MVISMHLRFVEGKMLSWCGVIKLLAAYMLSAPKISIKMILARLSLAQRMAMFMCWVKTGSSNGATILANPSLM